MTNHVDDLHLAGTRHTTVKIQQTTGTVFGTLKLEWSNFANDGARRSQIRTIKGMPHSIKADTVEDSA